MAQHVSSSRTWRHVIKKNQKRRPNLCYHYNSNNISMKRVNNLSSAGNECDQIPMIGDHCEPHVPPPVVVGHTMRHFPVSLYMHHRVFTKRLIIHSEWRPAATKQYSCTTQRTCGKRLPHLPLTASLLFVSEKSIGMLRKNTKKMQVCISQISQCRHFTLRDVFLSHSFHASDQTFFNCIRATLIAFTTTTMGILLPAEGD